MTGFFSSALGIACAGCLAFAKSRTKTQLTHGFLDVVHKDPDGKKAKYVLFVPHHYTGESPLPLILFLHGAGETGKDGKKQAEVGLGPVIRDQERTFPFFAVFPQSQRYTWKPGSSDARRALRILAEVRKTYRIDPQRIYLTGLSMGGYGTWSLAQRFPDRWAAIAPVCGGGNPEEAEKIKHLPCWCFHGEKDDVVSVELSREMVKALRKARGKPRYDEYPDVGHHSWEQAYATPELFDWFLKHQKKTK